MGIFSIYYRLAMKSPTTIYGLSSKRPWFYAAKHKTGSGLVWCSKPNPVSCLSFELRTVIISNFLGTGKYSSVTPQLSGVGKQLFNYSEDRILISSTNFFNDSDFSRSCVSALSSSSALFVIASASCSCASRTDFSLSDLSMAISRVARI